MAQVSCLCPQLGRLLPGSFWRPLEGLLLRPLRLASFSRMPKWRAISLAPEVVRRGRSGIVVAPCHSFARTTLVVSPRQQQHERRSSKDTDSSHRIRRVARLLTG